MDQKQFVVQTMRHCLRIDRVVSAFYSDLGKDFVSRGETHDFWELVYVDRGYLHVETGTRTYPQAQGQITFHPPMEYHRHIANQAHNTSLCIIAFHSDAPVLSCLSRRVMTLGEMQRQALSQTLRYATDIFSSIVDARDALYLVKKQEVWPAQEQLFVNTLESFLLLCVLDVNAKIGGVEPVSASGLASALTRSRVEELGQRAVDYLAAHLFETLRIPQMCTALGCSKTTLSSTFHAYTGSSIIQYFNRLKIEEAKNMIRFEDLSLTQIAACLNFCNLNYFSTAFKRYTGMYPREYAKSLKVHNGVYLLNPEHDTILKHE